MRTRYITILALAIATALAAAAPAMAHVTAQPPEQVAGGFTTVTFRVPSERPEPTTSVEVKFPPSITSARVMPVPGWEYDVKMVELDEPQEGGHGEEVTERIDTITWSGGEILDGEFMEFTVSVQMAEEGEIGDRVFFPAVQTYEGGERVGWIEKPADEDDDTELENPAPSVTLVEGDAHGASDDDADEEAAAGSEDDDANDDVRALYVLSIAALAIALLALLFGWKRGRRD